MLQQHLERVYGATPHLFAVPLKGGDSRCMPFFNVDFVKSAAALAEPANDGEHRWLFVMSKEDFVFLAGFESERFFDALRRRVETVLSVGHNRLTFIGPADLGRFLASHWPGEPRIRFLPFCDFDAFEAEIRRARVVAYWNTLSSSLLYCLYYRIPPIFFGMGHQARVCPDLFEHVVEHVYCGRAPALLDAGAPMEADADALLDRLGLRAWLDAIAGEYDVLPPPVTVVERLRQFHGGK